MKLLTISYILDLVLVIGIALAGLFLYMAVNRANFCASHQSEGCPQLFCPNEDDDCKNRAFRMMNGTKICSSKAT